MWKYIASALLVIMVFGCGAKTPQSFNPVSTPSWSVLEIREDIGYDSAWQTINEILINNYRIDFLDKEIGYIRTPWRYEFDQEYEGKYRSLVEVKFSPERDQLKIRAVSNYKKEGYWIEGTDAEIISSLKSDILGHLGRTSK